MQVFIKEALYVLDYNNNIVDTIFLSDDSLTAGYAYNITVEESNTGYSNLTFTMPTKILGDSEDINKITDKAQLIDNPKLKLLTPLVKLRYRRQIFYTGKERITVQEATNRGDETVFVEKVYSPNYPENIIEDYLMDYIVQPTQHKRSGLEVSVTYNAIDYPRFNLSKKKMGATINDDTVTKGIWSLYESEPLSIAGTVQYVRWTEDLSNAYEGNVNIPTEWSPSTATSFPLNETQINAMMSKAEEWPYGLTSTVFWWPITSTGRFEGIIYNEGDYLTLNIYPKFETGTVDASEITYSLDFYGYTWNYLDKGDSYLTPNNPCNYLNWVLETTNWSIATSNAKECVGAYFDINDFPTPTAENQYLLYQVIKKDSKYIQGPFASVEELGTRSEDEIGYWTVVSNDEGTYQYRWDGSSWYKEELGISKIDTFIYKAVGEQWEDCTSEIWTASIDKATGVLYDVDQVETEVAKPNHSVGDLFETTDLRCSLSASDSNCYNIITEIAKQFQLYPVFDCVNRTVALHVHSGYYNGLNYRLGYSVENTGVKRDGDKVITKLRCYGGQDGKGEENINLGEAERSYIQPTDNPDEREPWDPNAPEYIQARSPYGTEYIYNFKWMYDNGWMTKQQILDIYAENLKIQELNKTFLDPFNKDFLQTHNAYINAGVNYSTNQDEYLACLKSMMNTYYRYPGQTTEKFSAFPEPPADCRLGVKENDEDPDKYYLDVYYCENCKYTQTEQFSICPRCSHEAEAEHYTIHINTWAEEQKFTGTTSEQWKPSSRGFYQNIYNTFEGETHKFYIGKKFETEIIDDMTTVPTTKSNETKFFLEKKDGTGTDEFYDKSGGLYDWNSYVDKWLEYYGHATSSRKEVEKYEARIEMLKQEFKNYQHDLEILENNIQDNWGDYIVEGKFSDPQIVYPAILLAKSLEASEKYCIPEVTYSLNVVDSSGLIEYRKTNCDEVYNDLVRTLHNAGQIIPKAGDYVKVYDEQVGLKGVPGLITNIKRYLDKPQSNSITLDTAYTDADDLVGNIITATNTVLNNTDIYARTSVIKADGTIEGTTLTKSLEENAKDNIAIVGVKGSTLLDSSGLLVTNPSNPNRKMKYTGTGVYGTVDNGASYDLMMGPEGINANYINAGLIDTQSVQIISGKNAKVKLDNLGLSVVDNPSKSYYIPSVDARDTDSFRDWSQSNLKAFIGVDNNNEALLYLSGQMVVEKGSRIAGWNVLEDKLYSGSGSSYVGLGTSGDYRIWAGNSDPEKATFTIKKDGTVSGSNVNITGGTLKVGSDFNVTSAGALTAKSGKIAGFTIEGDTLYGSQVGMDAESGGDYAFWAGAAKGSSSGAPFRVGHDGSLTASKGTIGGWTVGPTSLSGSGEISGGTISGSAISGGSISGTTVTGSKISCNWDGTGKYYRTEIDSDGKFRYYNGTGYLTCGHSGNSHPLVSGLNVSAFTGISFANGTYWNNVGSPLANLYYSGSSFHISSEGNVNASGTNIALDSSHSSSRYVRINHLYACSSPGESKYWLCFTNTANNSPARIRSDGSNFCIYASGGIYAGGDGSSSKIAVSSSGPSSLNVKTNLKSLDDEYDALYEDMKKVKAYNYDYKYKNVQDDLTKDYGFIIDEIENTEHLSNYFRHYDAVKIIDENNALQSIDDDNPNQNKENLINIKTWERDSYIKGLFVMIKTLQHKIDQLEEQIKKEKTN